MHRLGWAALVAGVMVMVGAAGAQTPPPRAIVTNPSWASRPDADAMGEAYPDFAASAGIEGDVTLRCTARTDGGLDLCEVVRATPTGLGFDRAGLSLSRLFRVNPREVDGQDTKARVQFTIRFTARPLQPIMPWTGPEPDAAHLAATRVIADSLEPEVRADFLDSLEHIDVDADRVDKVRAMLVQVHEEFLERDKTAGILMMARLVTPDQLAVMVAGGPPPTQPSDEAMVSAGDQSEMVSRAEMDRLKVLYCAQFDCPVMPPSPTDSSAP